MIPTAITALNIQTSKLIFAALATLLLGPLAYAQDNQIQPSERETYTCADEQKHFESWSKIAGTMPETKLLQLVPNSQIVTVTAADSRTLRGLRMREGEGAKDALLVIQGNAWSTKSIVSIAPLFPTKKLDIFVFDFRGYGLSKPGNATMSAIISDYRDIGVWLQLQGYRNLYVYAYSFGGVIALNSFSTTSTFRRIVLDSVPARPSQMNFHCTVSYDPVDKVPQPCSSIAFMHGTSDWVVPRRYTQPLIDALSACGGVLDINESRGHPFQIEWQSSKIRRIDAMIRHLKLEGE